MKNLYKVSDWLDICTHQKIGEILIQSGRLNLIQLGMALDIQNFQSIQLGEILLNMKVITSDDLNQVLLVQTKIDENIEEGVM